jgi:hypothetical protein
MLRNELRIFDDYTADGKYDVAVGPDRAFRLDHADPLRAAVAEAVRKTLVARIERQKSVVTECAAATLNAAARLVDQAFELVGGAE